MSEPDPILRGPIPLHWIKAAAQLPGRSLHLAILAWCAASIAQGSTIYVSNIDALGFGIDRNSKYRALGWLEEAGLISVERKLGRSPLVTLLEHESPEDES